METRAHSVDQIELLSRAKRPNSCTPRPFLRWAGSKRLLSKHIVDLLPGRFGTYIEPFFGSGALFFLLQPRKAVISDSCSELVETHKAVRDNVSSVIRYLNPLRPRKPLYYQVRNNRSSGRFKRAAEFIFLNKSCWNGLYRVNAQGEFNVPFGMPKTDFIADLQNLKACSSLLSQRLVKLKCCDFEATLSKARPGDLVYLDPPYVTRHNNNGFADYNEKIFSWEDQRRLAAIATTMAESGVHVVVSNADHADVTSLYQGFGKRRINRRSTLASNSRFRDRVTEVVLYTKGSGNGN